MKALLDRTLTGIAGLLTLLMIAHSTATALGGSPQRQASPAPAKTSQETAARDEEPIVEVLAKRVDSLQFVIVYNADLLRREVESKLLWAFVLIGVLIVSSLIMYGATTVAHRQLRETEEQHFNQLYGAVRDVESRLSEGSRRTSGREQEGKKKRGRK